MRVSKEKAVENRSAILQAASRLFRERGIDATGVADIAKEAGLTHGALYAHFPSKDALAAEAFSHGFAGNMKLVRQWEGGRKRNFDKYLDAMFSTQQRDNLASGCPMTASASEIARQGDAISVSFAQGFEEMVRVLENSLNTEIPASQRRRLAIASLSAQIGAIAISRALAKVEPSLSKEVLRSTKEAMRSALTVTHDSGKKSRRRRSAA